MIRILSADQVANDLGLHRAEVVELMRRGDIPAKRIGSNLFTTSQQLAAFVAQADPRSVLPRYRAGDPVVVMDDDGDLFAGQYHAETKNGRVVVARTGFLGEHMEEFAPEQVQPLTARIPRDRKQ